MSNERQDRVWLITGCSTGFGRELVLAALAAGDRVMATARRPETLADLAELGNGRVSTAALDVTDPPPSRPPYRRLSRCSRHCGVKGPRRA